MNNEKETVRFLIQTVGEIEKQFNLLQQSIDNIHDRESYLEAVFRERFLHGMINGVILGAVALDPTRALIVLQDIVEEFDERLNAKNEWIESLAKEYK